MAITRNVLGMNARNFLYIRQYNTNRAKRTADDKLLTKEVLLKQDIPTPGLLAMFPDRSRVRTFDWTTLPYDGFVVKPSRGYGGNGIIVVKSWERDHGKTTSGKIVTQRELGSHMFDILDGAHSLQYLPDRAFIEARLKSHSFFRKLAPVGMPDIRIIVFNTIPVMAMLRLPTRESGGKANLMMGAIGVGVDIRSGVTTHAIRKGEYLKFIPGTKTKVRGLKVPNWNNLLLLAAKTQVASGLGYAGIDIVVDAKNGPLVLEVNSRPGLKIQNANLTSLRTRLERVEHMRVTTPARGVEIAQSLFTEPFSDKVSIQPKILPVVMPIVLKNKDKELWVHAKLDTGAYRSSIDLVVAKDMGFPISDRNIVAKSASGSQIRATAEVRFLIDGVLIKTVASVTDRSHLKYPMIVGRRDLKGIVVNPSTIHHPEEEEKVEEIE